MAKREDVEATTFIGNAPDLEFVFPGQSYLSAWASPEAFTKHIEEMDPKLAWDSDAWHGHHPSFYGSRSMKDTLEMARGGWKEGIERVERLHGRIMALYPIRKQNIQYDVVGAIPNVPRAVAGNPMNMQKAVTARSKRRPIITLVTDMSVSCGIGESVLTNRGAVLAALLDHIEAAGFSCEVISIALTHTGNFTACTAITIKQPHQPVDIPRMAFGLGHTSLFRRMVFADWTYNKACQILGGCLGSIYEFKSSEEFKEKDIYLIPSPQNCSKKFKTEELAATEGLKFVIDKLRQQGCPAFPKWEGDIPKEDEKSFFDEDDDD